MNRTILRISSSASGEKSNTRSLGDELIEHIRDNNDIVVERDLGLGVPLLTPEVTAHFRTPGSDRTALSPEALSVVEHSEQLIAELESADVVVIGAPIYNFSVPAALKAWADLVAQAGKTFMYTPEGPVGLMNNRPCFIITSSGGLPVNSPADFANPWLVWFLGFLGISTVQTFSAEGTAKDLEGALNRGREAIAAANLAIT